MKTSSWSAPALEQNFSDFFGNRLTIESSQGESVDLPVMLAMLLMYKFYRAGIDFITYDASGNLFASCKRGRLGCEPVVEEAFAALASFISQELTLVAAELQGNQG